MHIFFIGGYSGAGKSEALKYLESQGYLVFSSSRLLHDVYKKFHNTENDDSTDPKIAAEMIRIAEDVLIPVFGRTLFPAGVFNAMENPREVSDKTCIFIETVGGEEFYTLSQSLIATDSNLKLAGFNVRSLREKVRPKEYRKLLERTKDIPIIDLWNDGTIEKFHSNLDSIITVWSGHKL